MTTLEKLSEEYESVAKTAAMNLDDVPAATRGGWSTRVREAQDRLKDLRVEYRNALLKNGVAIFLEGDAAKVGEFVQLVVDGNEGLVVDANTLYDRLAREVEVSLSDQRNWGVTQTYRLHQALQAVMFELGLSEMPMPSRDSMPIVPTYADTVAHVKSIVKGAVDNQLNRLYIINEALNAAIKIRYIGVMAPVLITNATAEEARELSQEFGKGTATVKVTAEDEVNKDFLSKTFRDVNKKIRKK